MKLIILNISENVEWNLDFSLERKCVLELHKETITKISQLNKNSDITSVVSKKHIARFNIHPNNIFEIKCYLIHWYLSQTNSHSMFDSEFSYTLLFVIRYQGVCFRNHCLFIYLFIGSTVSLLLWLSLCLLLSVMASRNFSSLQGKNFSGCSGLSSCSSWAHGL